MRFGFLNTRVGRRFLAVNLLTAFLPVIVVTAVSFTYVRAELRDQAEGRVNRLGKSVGMTSLGHLTAVSQTLIGRRDSTVLEANFEATGQSDVARHDTAGTGELQAFTSAQRTHLQTGRPLLLLIPAPQGTALVLARAAAPWTGTYQPLTWGRVRTDALFSEIDEVADGEQANLCIYETRSLRRIHCSDGVTPVAESHALVRARNGGTGRESTDEGELFSAARDIYLRHEYGTDEWTVVAMQSSAATIASAIDFRNTFLLFTIAVIVLIFAISHAQIRRTTEPLERLEEATRRLRAGDFGTPVIVTSDDEFAQVADSFNGMASSLHRQLSLLRNLDAVDQSALGARDTIAVAAEALTTIGDSVTCDRISFAVAHATDIPTMSQTTRDVATNARRERMLVMSAAERDELLRNPRHLLLSGRADMRSYRASADHDSIVLPLVKDHELLGVVCIDLPGATMLTEECWSEARRITDRVALALSNVQLLSRLEALSTGTVLAFARAIDANSPWTAGHSERVTRVALEIGTQMGLSQTELDTLQRGGLLHDIGKIAVPPAVLDKAGRLTDDEWAVMRRHPIVGCEILSPIPAFADALPIVRSHHERMDGTGYPDQLYGEEIPMLARVMAVADVFDALSSDRPYRAGMSTEVACDIIQRGSGTHFDSRIVHAFMDGVHAGRIHASMVSGASATLAAAVARALGPVAQPA